jgi:hypothetical protein
VAAAAAVAVVVVVEEVVVVMVEVVVEEAAEAAVEATVVEGLVPRSGEELDCVGVVPPGKRVRYINGKKSSNSIAFFFLFLRTSYHWRPGTGNRGN